MVGANLRGMPASCEGERPWQQQQEQQQKKKQQEQDETWL
jgi:hypothetical protein